MVRVFVQYSTLAHKLLHEWDTIETGIQLKNATCIASKKRKIMRPICFSFDKVVDETNSR
jgi:hypothetical protein